MAEVTRFETLPREVGTKGAVRSLRRSGRVPGVVYGAKQAQELISLEARILRRALRNPRFASTLCTLELNGGAVQALPREVQKDPVSDEPIHIDFIRIAKGARVTVTVPVHFSGEEESQGLRRGGVLNVVRREIELTCPADAIPEEVTLDLSGADINDSLHISQVRLPANVEVTITGRDFTVASIAPPSLTPEEEDAAAEAAEAEAAEAPEGEEAEEPAGR
jgi:large subunit ribosomal protein L25